MPNKLFIGIFLFCPSLSVSYSESIIDDIDPENENEEFLPNMSKEKIEKISASKRIYIITNNNHSFQKGDFISLIFNGDLVARALVAKTVSGVSGIKLLRIYSNNLLTLLRPGVEVHVLRGDDSYFKKKASASKEEEITTTSSDEEDLYNSLTLFEEKDNAFLDEEGKRIIKQDNILSLEPYAARRDKISMVQVLTMTK